MAIAIFRAWIKNPGNNAAAIQMADADIHGEIAM
jgi:hypothetical protein